MAKGNLFQGLAKGSIGDVVFYRNNGQQVSRVRNRQVKNPRTSAQMSQRTLMQNVAQAYSAMKKIVDHSRQGISYGAKTMAAFMKDNLDITRNAAVAEYEHCSWVDKDFQYAPALPLIMSRGTLPNQSEGFSFYAGKNGDDFAVGIRSEKTYIRQQSVQGDIELRADEFLPLFDLTFGDMLTFCFLISYPDYRASHDSFTVKTEFLYGRLKIVSKQPDEDDWKAKPILESGIIDYNDSNLSNQYTGSVPQIPLISIGSEIVDESSDLCAITIQPHVNLGGPTPWVLGACVIKSRKQNGSYLRSTEIMRLPDLSTADDKSLNSFYDALQSYMGSSESLGGSPYYLNGGK